MINSAHMVDLRLTPKDTAGAGSPCLPCASDLPAYPYGLCISLTENELTKLGVTIKDFDVEDMVHLHCLAVVSATSENKSQNGSEHCRVELQVTHIECESEDEENQEVDKKDRLTKLYK